VLLSRWRVDLAWLGLLAVPLARPSDASILWALPLLAFGVALRLWARGHLERGRAVARTGPYAFVRHPLYVGSFFIALGFACITRRPWFPPLVIVIFLVLYVPKALREEAWLRKRFPKQYEDYASRVGAVFPRTLTPWSDADVRFRWRRVLRHREWQTWIGVAALLFLMWIRAATLASH